jgi:RING-like zinc finger
VRRLPTRRWTREKATGSPAFPPSSANTANTANTSIPANPANETSGNETAESSETRTADSNDASQGDISPSGGVIPQGYGSRTRRAEVLECVVCLEDFVEGDVIITLPCHHEFHQSCMYVPVIPRLYLIP